VARLLVGRPAASVRMPRVLTPLRRCVVQRSRRADSKARSRGSPCRSPSETAVDHPSGCPAGDWPGLRGQAAAPR
jgi:hypothetical protein